MSDVNKYGQAMGRKGADTRQRLLDAARAVLAQDIGAKLTVTGIARLAGTSGATFYLYFRDINDVLLALSEEAVAGTAEVLAILGEPWDRRTLADHSRRFVEAFYRYWNQHREVLAVRNFQSDRGSKPFDEVRRRAALPIVRGMADRIQSAQGEGELSAKDALARSVIIYAAMERLASRRSTAQLQAEELEPDDMLRAEAYIITLLFTPMGLPAPVA